MFCPSCGSNNSVEQRFCRSCGLNLEQIALSLLGQKPSKNVPEIRAAEQRLEKLGTIAFGGLALVVVIGVLGMIYTIVLRFILNGSSVISGIFFIVLLVFAVLGLAYVVLNENLKEKKLAARNPHVELESNSIETGKLLEEKQFHPVPSVIEGTTELLGARRKAKRSE